MRLDRSHRVWCAVSVLILAAAVGVYMWRTVGVRSVGMEGGTVLGLIFGGAGAFCMIYAALLGVRKRLRSWRLGPADFWLKSHLWLGALSVPLIWLHGGFRHGGPLTAWLMWLLYIVVISGLIGAFLQHMLPRLLWQRIARETVFEQIPHVAELLAKEVEKLSAGVAATRSLVTVGTAAERSGDVVVEEAAEQAAAMMEQASPSAALVEFIELEVRPFLKTGNTGALMDRQLSAVTFKRHREAVPVTAREAVDRLEEICEERRQLSAQQKLHLWLHLWMLVHVPPSVALLILGAYHAVAALRY